MRLTVSRLAIAVVLLLNLATFVTLCLLYTPMYPLPRGNSEDFWSEAVHVHLRGHEPGGSIACIEGDAAYYLPPSMDAVWVHRLPLSEAMADYPTVLTQIKKDAADPANTQDDAVGYRLWISRDPDRRTGITGLIGFVQDAVVARRTHTPESSVSMVAYFSVDNAELAQQIARAHLYPANFVFEFLFLSTLVWFVLWPAIRCGSSTRTYSHLAATPFLFFLPS